MPSIRERTEELEGRFLSLHAALASQSRGRERPEQPDDIRTCFQRDRDRILHCKAFRRLKHKTQVFVDPDGDHYRTRLTHTLEVAQIARTVARALRLNEDLTEAIALGHDLGHPPFGHAGEQALDEEMRAHGRSFRHDEQSLRVVRVLERDGAGLNLTWETLEGIAGHSKGRADLSLGQGGTMEADAVRVSDRIAYLNHDLDDAFRAGLLRLEELPEPHHGHSERITAMVTDVITATGDGDRVRVSERMAKQMDELKEFMFERVYLSNPATQADIDRAKRTVRALFRAYLASPSLLPPTDDLPQAVCDYVAGMTDRFALRRLRELEG